MICSRKFAPGLTASTVGDSSEIGLALLHTCTCLGSCNQREIHRLFARTPGLILDVRKFTRDDKFVMDAALVCNASTCAFAINSHSLRCRLVEAPQLLLIARLQRWQQRGNHFKCACIR